MILAGACRYGLSRAEAQAERRLGFSVGLALVLHLLLLANLPGPRPWSAHNPGLRLELRPPPPAATALPLEPPLRDAALPRHPANPMERPGEPRPASAAPPATTRAATEAAPGRDLNPAPEPARPNLEQARELARNLGRQLDQERPGNALRLESATAGRAGSGLDRPALPAVARIAQRPGERRVTVYADGTMRIDDPSGQSRCLRPLAPTPSVGPLEMLAIPTNCP
ncbi:MAG: hypothetical protein RIR00_634 [Pseudomonadota bacterium]|jgi:hypothetical protein